MMRFEDEILSLLQDVRREDPGAVSLARVVSLAVRVEPELLRHARLILLPGEDAGAEADLWFSPLVQSDNPLALVLLPEVKRLLQEDLAKNQELLDRAWSVLKEVHRDAPLVIQLEEEVTWLALSSRADAPQRVERLLQSAVVAMVKGNRRALAHWALHVLPRLPTAARQSEAARMLAVGAGARVGGPQRWAEDLQIGAAQGWLRYVLPENLQRVPLGVRLLEQAVEFGDPSLAGAHVLELPETDPLLLEVSWDESGSPRKERISLKPGASQVIEVRSHEVRLRTALGEIYTLRQRHAIKSIWSQDIEAVLDSARLQTSRTIRLDDQRIMIPSPFPSPENWRDQWIYFILVDRFNNPRLSPRHLPWDAPYSDFQGGTFDGIRQQLPYLQNLGVGALWLSPVLKNCQYSPSYHGYGIQDFLSIDPRFASDPAQDPQLVENELRQLIDEAHARGMYIILDIVLHHTGDVFAYQNFGSLAPGSNHPYTIYWRDEKGNPRQDWTEAPADPPLDAAVWPQELRTNAFFRRRGNAFGDSGEVIDITSDFYSLRGLVTDLKDDAGYMVLNILIRAYQYLIARYDIDGFRIDTLKYISPAFAREFANGIREFAQNIGKKNFFTFGEVWDSEQTISSFINRDTLQSEEVDPIGVDAALDYPLFYNLPEVAKGMLAPGTLIQTFETRKQVARDSLSSNGDANNFFVTFLDNHDQISRFYYLDPANPHAFDDQLTLAVACLFALPGIPCLYYGTEQGLSGSGNAPGAVREALWGKPGAFDQSSAFYRAFQQLATLRKNQQALRYGRYYFRPISGDGSLFGISTIAPGVLAFSRILSNLELLIVANTNTQSSWTGEIIVDFTINPPGATYTILYSNKTQPIWPGPVTEKPAGSVQVTEIDGTITGGPLHVLPVNLQPMEVQIVAG